MAVSTAGLRQALEQLADLFVPANEKGRRKK